jgi:hypothetical protein
MTIEFRETAATYPSVDSATTGRKPGTVRQTLADLDSILVFRPETHNFVTTGQHSDASRQVEHLHLS